MPVRSLVQQRERSSFLDARKARHVRVDGEAVAVASPDLYLSVATALFMTSCGHDRLGSCVFICRVRKSIKSIQCLLSHGPAREVGTS